MLIRAGFDIAYECSADTPMLLMVHVRPERHVDLKTREDFTVEPAVPYRTYTDSFGNICTQLVAPKGMFTLACDFVIEDSGLPDPASPGARQHTVDELPPEILFYLLGSRYCETDRLSQLAWSLFQNTPRGWARVQAIVDYVHDRIEFGYAYARPTKTAWEAHEERKGVCRDYAHLAVAMCRCMNIPARYCTGYLGDIGIPFDPSPMDFSAWFEAYLDGAWHTFDARHNKPRIGRILMARGRDATDTAISTAFGSAELKRFVVVSEELKGG
jgi:transglutaminase-like putative cysteine protease